jgi:signal transduction histidine kinase
LGYANVLEDAATVLRSLIPIEREIRGEDGVWYLTRFLPYRTVEDRIDGVVITFVAITELKRAQQEAQKLAQQQAAVALLGRLALEGTDLDLLFDKATEQVCEVFGVDFGEVLEAQADGEALLFKAGQGWDRSWIDQMVVPLRAKSQTAHALTVSEPVLVEDWSQEKRFKPLAYVREEGITSSASVAIAGWRRPYGLLGAHSRQKRSFSEDDVSFFQAVANLLAVAIGRKQFEEQLKALNETLEERVEWRTTQVRNLASELLFTEQRVRQHVAQVLHDDLQQLLFAAQIHVQFVRQGLTAEQAALVAEIEQVKNMIEEALGLTRRLTLDLSPPVLEEQNLGEAMQWLANHVKELHGLEVELKLGEIPIIPSEDIPPLLFQIVRELLFNIVKHAGVKQAQVRALTEGENLVVQVRDKGAGFDPATARQDLGHDGGYGLRHMSERLGLFNGRLDIVSQPGKGTTVTVIIPQREGEAPLM